MKHDTTNQYRCSMCGGVFDKGWSDDEAKKELDATFPGIKVEDCDVVCDDCYKKIGF